MDVRPILKWAGGKRQLLPALRQFYPESFIRYAEPFVGSGAVFLDLHNTGRLEGCTVELSDINADVIGCYRAVRDSTEEVIESLRELEHGHHTQGRDHFYEVRDGRFNPARAIVQAGANPNDGYTPALAAMLIYLNRTGYNGLFRVNSRGIFNVPAGRYGSVRICDADNLRRLAAALRRPGLRLEVRRFGEALLTAGAGDFVYLDPPYSPLSRTAHFTSYTSDRFGPDEQQVLQQAVIRLAGRGAQVVLSNSVAPEIGRLYADSPEARRAGLRARKVPARRAINSRSAGRGPVLEYLITNVR
ncbi:MAG: Dam family site-specific DNA-(adenine-N6)-methyltransferase [Acidobacteria bacterium]|nr:Dam family site-specific DNA-(adenine-N6)-methyltransferase [Acidobacteriota bacterium]MCA1651180.1 Dam family site-specific DNA-(adenine-N6)-methyltransferase [Acidobacteriota bacterium]